MKASRVQLSWYNIERICDLMFFPCQLNAEELANNLKLKEFDVLLLHGDMDQIERNKVITAFKKKDVSTLVATDVAGN